MVGSWKGARRRRRRQCRRGPGGSIQVGGRRWVGTSGGKGVRVTFDRE